MSEQNRLSPELVVLSKKLAQAEVDYDQLRSSMVQQVSHFRKLVKAIFDLDDGYFGGRFQSEDHAAQANPQQDLGVALKVVEAVSEELQGASAFVDSPLLRDQVANLVAAVESMRDAAIEADRAATNAVGFSGTVAVTFPVRIFPDNNPLACLTEAVGFLRDLQGLVAKLKDRVGALVLMSQEADEARNEAEAATAKTIESRSVVNIAGSLSAELDARVAELAALRANALGEQERHAEELRRIRGEIRTSIDAAQEEVIRETELHRGDLAEARSLAAEIERMASADPESSQSDDLDITIGVLRDALKEEDSGLGPLTAAAESVLVTWTRLVGERAAAAAKELSMLRGQLDQSQAAVEALKSEIIRISAEHKRLQESEKSFGTAREAVSKELSQLRTQVAEQARDLHSREAALKVRDETAQRLQEQQARTVDELARERAAREEERERQRQAIVAAQAASMQSAGQFEAVIQRARTAAEDAERQLGEVRVQLTQVRAEAESAHADAGRFQVELGRANDAVSQAQLREREAVAARERAERQVTELKARSEAGSAETTHLRTELERLHAELAKASLAVETAGLRESAAISARGEAERARHELELRCEQAQHQTRLVEDKLAGSTQRQDELEREVAALTAVRDRLVRTESEVAQTAAACAQAQQATTLAQAEVVRLQGEITRIASEAQARERHATQADSERSRTVTALAERDARIAELAHALDQTRTAAAEAQTVAGTAQAELARLKTLHAGAVQARDQAAADLAVKLASEATATAERDTAKAALATAYAERDRLQAQVERQRADLEAQGGLQRQREEEFSGKLADAARASGEAKHAAEMLKAENDRLRSEIDRADSRSATDIKKAERRATETQKAVERLQQQLEEAKERISSLCGELSEAQAMQQNLYERAETETAMAEGNARRWAQERTELIGLVKQAKLAVQNAKIARESDLSRIGELEGQLAILATLKPS